MTKKVLSLINVGSMRKVAVILMIAIFMVVCSGSVYAQQKTTVDKEKFDKLTPEQKEKFVKMAKEARDTALGSVRDHDAVAKEAEKAKSICEKTVKYAALAEIAAVGATVGTPTAAVIATGAAAGVEETYNSLTKKEEKK